MQVEEDDHPSSLKERFKDAADGVYLQLSAAELHVLLVYLTLSGLQTTCFLQTSSMFACFNLFHCRNLLAVTEPEPSCMFGPQELVSVLFFGGQKSKTPDQILLSCYYVGLSTDWFTFERFLLS